MQVPINITYRGIEKSAQLEEIILTKAARLDRFCDYISRCDVAIEQPNHAHQKGNPVRVRIDVTVPPGHELVADEETKDSDAPDPLGRAVHDAFKTMERQLRHLVQRQRRE